ncbi:putative MPP superfamily phosphohydrolase [Azospirillum fermentarium]|uniref:metallophosphoesterase family protein n=1 Tax=Azospirillum fermentarium TaxID=1233114 RepID=UPI00222719C7|nr:metallophosphoesterase [Azospirillum fermentarium]MCW2248905.1 putative MPP superfamily phosphohydrolase [Azospirillum fermentarium]
MPIRWLHLSDCHVGSQEYGAHKLFKETAAFVRQRRETTGWEPDLVFLTGDIAYSGQADQYEQAKAELLAPLDEALGGTLT